MHIAIHDALNAIEPRSRPYAFATRQPLPDASPDAAVAAAAHGVLIPMLEQLPAPFSDCAPASIEGVEDDYAAALATLPDGRAEQQGVQLGRAAAALILALRTGDGADTTVVRHGVPSGHHSRRVPLHAGLLVRIRAAVGGRHPVRTARQLAVPRRSPLRGHEQEVRSGLRRGQASRR